MCTEEVLLQQAQDNHSNILKHNKQTCGNSSCRNKPCSSHLKKCSPKGTKLILFQPISLQMPHKSNALSMSSSFAFSWSWQHGPIVGDADAKNKTKQKKSAACMWPHKGKWNQTWEIIMTCKDKEFLGLWCSLYILKYNLWSKIMLNV